MALLGNSPEPPNVKAYISSLNDALGSSTSNLASLLGPDVPPATPPRRAPVIPRAALSQITFQDLRFSGPFPFATAQRSRLGGIYAICVYDNDWGPRPYRPIYFGEAGNREERVTTSHEKFAEWVRVAGTRFKLYVAFRTITDVTARRIAERRLIEHYKPECNDQYNPFYGLYDPVSK